MIRNATVMGVQADHRRFLLLLAFLAVSRVVFAEYVLVRTETRMATGEPVGIRAHALQLDRELTVPGPLTFPGGASRIPPLLASNKRHLFLISGPSPRDLHASLRRDYLNVCRVAPFDERVEQRVVLPWGRRAVAAALRPGPEEELILLLHANGGEEDARGWVYMYSLAGPGGGLVAEGVPAVVAIPNTPVAGAVTEDGRRYFVLCASPASSEAIVREIDLAERRVVDDVITVGGGDAQFGAAPVGIALDYPRRRLYILTTGYAVGRPSGEIASWLHSFNLDDRSAIAPPRELPGTASPGDHSVVTDETGDIWVSNYTIGSEFGHVTCLRADTAGLGLVIQETFRGADRPPDIVPTSPESVAIGVRRTLYFANKGQRARPVREFEAPIETISYAQDHLYVGEGGRAHRVSIATGESQNLIQLQTGFVTALVPIDDSNLLPGDLDGDGLTTTQEIAFSFSPDSPDTDGDGVPDGVDPEPTAPSPRLALPHWITFHGEAVGLELKALVLNPEFSRDREWRIEIDRDAVPWLDIYPVHGVLPSVVYMRVNPDFYRPNEHGVAEGRFRIHVAGAMPGTQAWGSPAEVGVMVAQDRNEIRRILWVRDTDETQPPDFAGVKDLLAASPHRFSHTEVEGPLREPLDPYTVVVLELRAASRGAMTRQALLDYVAGGGALLLIGRHDERDEPATFGRWLEPLGIHVDPGDAINGTFAAVSDHEITRSWTNFTVINGRLFRLDRAETVLVPGPLGPNSAILAQLSYGLGRIVVLAAPTPLESIPTDNAARLRFAEDLFRWLARARKEIQDFDGDGLPDALEDRNGNGARDPGETDFLYWDTDGDGIPDSLEDLNRNGEVDQGETSPLNPDSDADSVFDGADPTPLPPADAPVIFGLDPSEGPAEGGTMVIISGRNFAPDSVVWFGGRRSPRVRKIDASRLLAMTPAYDELPEGAVKLRVTAGGDALEGELPFAFRYTPRTVIDVKLVPTGLVELDNNIVQGVLELIIDNPNVEIGQATLFVVGQPLEALRDMAVHPSPEALHARRTVTGELPAPAFLRIDISDGKLQKGLGRVGTITWTADRVQDRIRFVVPRITVTSRHGAVFDTRIQPAEIALR